MSYIDGDESESEYNYNKEHIEPRILIYKIIKIGDQVKIIYKSHEEYEKIREKDKIETKKRLKLKTKKRFKLKNEKNKNYKIQCECGSIIRKYYLTRHKRTESHKLNMLNLHAHKEKYNYKIQCTCGCYIGKYYHPIHIRTKRHLREILQPLEIV